MSTVYFRIAARGPLRPVRARALERLIARAHRASVGSWRTEAFRTIARARADPPAIAAAQLRARGAAARAEWAAVATPVHLVAGMSNVQLPADGILDIGAAEADDLAQDFNRSFGGGGAHLVRGPGSALLCVFDQPLAVDTAPPEEVLGKDVWAHQPRGADSAALRRLGTEIEMWLFGHAVNAARGARGVPVISALWLWGGGPGNAPVPCIEGRAAGDDALFSAIERQSQYPGAAGAGPPRSGVVVLADWPGTAAWRESEQRWLDPALCDLKAGGLQGIEISAAATSFSLNARSLRRFWRRTRPWWEAFGLDAMAAEGAGLGD